MKILLYDDTPAYFCHGGKQVLAQKLYESLRALGINVEYARWWDPNQKCDLIHMFGCSPSMIEMAHQAGAKVVLTHIVDGMTNSSWAKLTFHRFRNYAILHFLPLKAAKLFHWYILPKIDSLVYIHKYDSETAIKIYGVPSEKCNVIPHGCDTDQIARLQTGPQNSHSYLVSVGSIVPRKNSVLLAKAAKRANVPIVFLGKPFSDEASYYQEFLALVDDKNVIYPGFVTENEKIKWLTEASGFVLLSKGESGCIAIYEAAAARLPLLLSELPWAHAYGESSTIHYVSLNDEVLIANRLTSFFTNGHRLDVTSFPVKTWETIAEEYISIYNSLFNV